MAVFASRQIVIPPPISVTITGTGDADYCYATINGTKQYEAGTHEVNAGDTIMFLVLGSSSNSYGSVTINETVVMRVTSGTTQTYDWTVPSGISTIEISMTSEPLYSRITVTTA